MDIAIIGAGNVGKALATAFTRAGHNVVIASRDPEDAGAVAAATGSTSPPRMPKPPAPPTSSCWPSHSPAPPMSPPRSPRHDGKPVVDVTNRISFGPNGPEIDTTSSNGEAIAAYFPDAHVVKAFNTLFASNQADPIADGVQLDGFVAGDDAAAKAKVLELVASVGLNPVDVGPLSRSRQLEALSFLNMALNITRNGTWQSGWKLVGAPATVPVAA